MPDALPSIAIVDDDESVLKALSRLLGAAGLDVHAFGSGREFLDSLATAPVECVLLDIRMPDLDGFAVARHLAAASERLPFIFMTAHDSETNRRLAEELGAVAFLRKPASEEKILAVIRRALAPAASNGAEPTNGTKVL